GQSALHGTFLWQQVDTVIKLKQNWRAKDDILFVEMLNRICMGRARKVASSTRQLSNYDVLKSQRLSKLKESSPEEFCSFKDAPVIMMKKVLRDVINKSKVCSFTHESNQQYKVSSAQDRIAGVDITPQQQRRMWKMGSTDTNDVIGELPLIPGISVMITENAATSCKIMNGSRGTLKSVTYKLNGGHRYAVCALVNIPESTLHVPGLDNGVVPILPVITSYKFATGEKMINIRHTQLPILPRWAFTDLRYR
ncbi:hypothetical protein EV702DRAFT_962419, partial [Suillus placidus]